MTKTLDRINSIRAVSCDNRSTLISRFYFNLWCLDPFLIYLNIVLFMKHFFYWEGIRVLPVTSLWGLYATPILQYSKNTRKVCPIISIPLCGREVALSKSFFDAPLEKKINKHNQFWSKLLKKECFSSFQSISSYTNTAFMHVFLFGTGLLGLDMKIIFHHFAKKTSVKRLEW